MWRTEMGLEILLGGSVVRLEYVWSRLVRIWMIWLLVGWERVLLLLCLEGWVVVGRILWGNRWNLAVLA